MTSPESLRAVAVSCSLKPSPDTSSSELMAQQILDSLAADHGVGGRLHRAADFDIKPGVLTDMGDGDEWPTLRRDLLDADILVFVTPTWLGHASSIAQRVLERLDAELSQTDESGRKSVSGKVAVVAVVGNEDGAHKIIADCFQALNDVGFTIAANGSVYWNANIEKPADYEDLPEIPAPVASMMRAATANSVHLARNLAQDRYPTPSNGQ